MSKSLVIKIGYEYYLFEGKQGDLIAFLDTAGNLIPLAQDYVSGSGYTYTVKTGEDEGLDVTFELVKQERVERPEADDWVAIKKAKKEAQDETSKRYGAEARVRQLEAALEKHGIQVDKNGCSSVKVGED